MFPENPSILSVYQAAAQRIDYDLPIWFDGSDDADDKLQSYDRFNYYRLAYAFQEVVMLWPSNYPAATVQHARDVLSKAPKADAYAQQVTGLFKSIADEAEANNSTFGQLKNIASATGTVLNMPLDKVINEVYGSDPAPKASTGPSVLKLALLGVLAGAGIYYAAQEVK